MLCPNCKAIDTKVIDSRLLNEGLSIRRRRKCGVCEKRFTTYESLQINIPAIVKNDGRRETFDESKLMSGLKKACQKRPISVDQIHELIASVAKQMGEMSVKEVPSEVIGEITMEKLYQLDAVAYVRFASFYWDFADIDTFVQGLQSQVKIRNTRGNIHEQKQQ